MNKGEESITSVMNKGEGKITTVVNKSEESVTSVGDEDVDKSLNLVTVCEEFTQVFRGSVFREGFEILALNPKRKFKDVRKYFSNQIGVDFKNLVFMIDRERVGDDDTLESLNICNSATVISVSVEQNIQVHIMYFRLGQDTLTLTSEMRLGFTMEEWKSEISGELGEPVHYLSFMWEDSNIADLDTPERIGIQNGDTIKVYCSSVIKIHMERDGEVLTDYLIHVDEDFVALAKMYSRVFHVGINSVGFKFEERDVNLFFDTANKIGLIEDGTIQVFHQRKKGNVTVEFYVENSSLFSIFPRLCDFPLLWDASTFDQVFLLKYDFEELFIEEIDPSLILFLHNAKEINNCETFQEIGVIKDDKICIDVLEHDDNENEMNVYVKRNMKETKSSMGKGQQCDNEEICAFKLDSSKPLSEFIKKVKSRITCNSKKEKLFISFNDTMVNKDDFGKKLKLSPFNNCFRCYAFPNLDAFKKHLETCRSVNASFRGIEDVDIPTAIPKYQRSNKTSSDQNQGESILSEDFDFPSAPLNNKYKHGEEQNSNERTKDIKKKLKALQMRINVDQKKKETSEGAVLAKDIQNHKDFENVDDILKFIGEEDLTSKTSKKNKNQVGSSERRKYKNKLKIKTQTASKEFEKVDVIDKSVPDSTIDDLNDEVRRSKGNVKGDERSEMSALKREGEKQKTKNQDVCGDVRIDEQNWQKVQSKKKNNLKLKTTTFSHPEKLFQKTKSTTAPFSHHEKLLYDIDENYIEKHVNKSIQLKQQVSTVLAEDEEETRKWCQLMVAARKRKDEQRKRDYIKYREMQSCNLSPQLDETNHGSNTPIFCDEVSSRTQPFVPQP